MFTDVDEIFTLKKLHEKANFNIRNDCTKITLKIKEQLYKSQKWGLYIILLRSL